MKKILKTLALAVSAAVLSFTAISCASTQPHTYRVMPEAQLDLGSLSRDQFIIVGQVSGTSSVTVKTADLTNDEKNFAYKESKWNNYTILGDNGNYGFVGKANTKNLTVQERAIALATYRMVETAQFNGADAVLYVQTTVNVEDAAASIMNNEKKIRVTVTGLAIKLKADSGYEIKLPPSQEPPKKVQNTTLPGTEEDFATVEATSETAAEDESAEE